MFVFLFACHEYMRMTACIQRTPCDISGHTPDPFGLHHIISSFRTTQRSLWQMLPQHIDDRLVLLQHQELIHVKEGHVRVIVLVLGDAHVITVHLPVRARFGHDPHRISRVPSLILPFEQFMVLRVVDEIDRVESQAEVIIHPAIAQR